MKTEKLEIDINQRFQQLITIQKGYIKVKVIPHSPKTEIRSIMLDNTVKIAIQKPPEKNKANEELIAFLSKLLKTKANQIKIISGFTETTKLIRINQDTIES